MHNSSSVCIVPSYLAWSGLAAFEELHALIMQEDSSYFDDPNKGIVTSGFNTRMLWEIGGRGE